ncbi:MAG: MBL fold metallo-hydrolase [Candidatus ainarchaeum sp.]|nr:MBL fold metallo-hydrolase [Candidatus ainarchaeum sp.]
MKLTVLGSGSPISGPERATSGYLVESSQGKIVLDLGFGCFKNLQKICNPPDISAICFSHFSHPDHVADLVAFLMHRKVSSDFEHSSPNQLNLFGPAGFGEFFSNLMKTFPFFVPLPFPVKVTEVSYDKLQIFDFAVRTKPVKHVHGAAIGFRIESEGKTIMYSGDSGYCDALVELGKDSDLMVLECSTLGRFNDVHLMPEDCAKIAKQANAKALMLSHLFPDTEKLDFQKILSEKFSGKIIKAKDLLKVEA